MPLIEHILNNNNIKEICNYLKSYYNCCAAPVFNTFQFTTRQFFLLFLLNLTEHIWSFFLLFSSPAKYPASLQAPSSRRCGGIIISELFFTRRLKKKRKSEGVQTCWTGVKRVGWLLLVPCAIVDNIRPKLRKTR